MKPHPINFLSQIARIYDRLHLNNIKNDLPRLYEKPHRSFPYIVSRCEMRVNSPVFYIMQYIRNPSSVWREIGRPTLGGFFPMEKAVVTQGNKRKREELYLPSLRFVVADDWMEKIGPIALCAWLRLHTFVDRRDPQRTQDIVPTSLIQLATRLGMSKSKFYKTVVKPLWNHGLIDIVEYENSTSLGQKPKNIIVYRSPFNLPGTDVEPLFKARDYDTEYISIAREFGKKGGQPRHKVRFNQATSHDTDNSSITCDIERVIPCQTDEPPGIQNEPGVTEPHIDSLRSTPVQIQNHPPLQICTQ
jgi:hypothetical protein